MDQCRRCQVEPTFGVGGYKERLTMLPPPPEEPLPDPRAPRDRATLITGLSPEDQGEREPDMHELREPTDVDGRRWWDEGQEDDEDAVITLRPPRFQQTH